MKTGAIIKGTAKSHFLKFVAKYAFRRTPSKSHCLKFVSRPRPQKSSPPLHIHMLFTPDMPAVPVSYDNPRRTDDLTRSDQDPAV
ncbi:hypothetical protein BaRGS_00021249 [Batillaria attramentaria]|uniref:Uncharacterized protein n=1 Tax=Batillaria attramentaria TaxID=370345 RepID=A0ABD0KKD5_9CAEN